MKSIFFLSILMISTTYSYGLFFETFENKKIQIVYSFAKGNNDVDFCFSINAYIDGNIYAYHSWPTISILGDDTGVESECREIYKYYSRVSPELKEAIGVYCNYFNPIRDSLGTLKYPVSSFNVTTNSIYVEDTNNKADLILQKDGKTSYIAFNIVASVIIAHTDSIRFLGDCITMAPPSQSFFNSESGGSLSSIFLGEIKSYSQIDQQDLEKMKFIASKCKKIHFLYVDR